MTQNLTGRPPTASRSFHGLFCGINQYQSTAISNLKSAVADAAALHALFTDNLGGDAKLVIDAEATTDRLRTELRALQSSCAEDDVVVLAFSGHGSDTHELVTYDTNPWDIAATALPLAELTDLVAAIPAKHLLIVLDCCFSGGAGSKVLHAENLARGGPAGLPPSTDALLSAMQGTGRVILTASTADQEAWENPRLGHGYLTWYLLQALLGAAGPASTDSFNFLDLLKYVTEQVITNVSGATGALQEPTLRGQWDGEVIWPRFVAGSRYNQLYPPQAAAPVTRDISSLANHGLPSELISAWSQSLPGLNDLQQAAINEAGLFAGNNVLVMAPTSSGKTMVGELAALRATQTGGRSVFLLPTKALVNEQYERFSRTYGPSGVRVLRATGDVNDDVGALLRGQFDLALFTYEKFSALVLANRHLLRLLSVVVVDEVQTVVDPTRGRELELLLTLIKTRSDEDIAPQIIALSAVLGNLNGLDTWMNAYLLERTERPVKLDEGVLNMAGQYRYRDADGAEYVEQLLPHVWGDTRAQTLLVPLVRKLISDGQQVIVIRGERGAARGAAEYLARDLGLGPASDALARLPDGDPTASTTQLRRGLQGGVAFHVSDLGSEERRVVEEEFRRPDSQIRVVVATTTLAQGINMPAETVIMPELSRRIGRGQIQWYQVAEYKNIAGRAGRLGLAERGRAITFGLSLSDTQRVWTGYVNGAPEDIHSTLLGERVDLYTVVLRIVAIAGDRSDDRAADVEDLVGILANSFAAHQARVLEQRDAFQTADISAVIFELQRVGFIEDTGDNRTRLTDLGRLVSASALTVSSAVRVASVIRRLSPNELTPAGLIALSQTTEELDATRLTVNVRGIQRELGTFATELNRRVSRTVSDALNANVTPQVFAARCKKAVACMLWIRGVPLGEIERTVMQHYFDRNASGPIGQVVSRTHDVIATVIDMAAVIHASSAPDLARLSERLPVRLEIGIQDDVVDLAMGGADLRREDYLRLSSAGLSNYVNVAAASDQQLRELLGDSSARLRTLRAACERIAESQRVASSLEDMLGPADSVT